ncbi:hypothetical protein Shewana3_1385 [Shewanella sp. ANA-3]|nr:hypothetical protein Shewana3_1385 [Shewanella sp. ANA-3]
MSIIVESLGVWLRYVGSLYDEPALGYSSHVRLATLGRFFILISAPLLGLLIDNGIDSKSIAYIGFLTFLLVFVFLLISFNVRVTEFIFKIYHLLNRETLSSGVKNDFAKSFFKITVNKKLVLCSSFSFLMTASGILIVNYLATIFIDNRAMIVQMSAFITMFGTLIHAFLVDPVLARNCDENIGNALSAIVSFIYGRLFSSILLTLFFGFLGLL